MVTWTVLQNFSMTSNWSPQTTLKSIDDLKILGEGGTVGAVWKPSKLYYIHDTDFFF